MTARIWIRTRRPVGEIPAGAEGRLIPHESGDRRPHVRIDFGPLGTVKWYPPGRKVRPTSGRGRAIKEAQRNMLKDCEVIG